MKWLRLEGAWADLNPCSSPTGGCLGPCLDGFCVPISKVKNYSLAGKSVAVLSHSCSQSVFLDVQTVSPAAVVPFPLVLALGTTENSSLFAPSPQVFIQWWDPHWAFCSSGWTVPVFSAFSHRRDALVPLSFSWPFICQCLLYLAVQNLAQHSRNGPTGAEWSLLAALLLVQPRIPSAFAG